MTLWEWIIIAMFLVVVTITIRVMQLERNLKQKKNTIELHKKWLVDHLNRANDNILIVSDCLYPIIFNYVTDYVREKLTTNPQFKVDVFTGPTIYRYEGQSKLHELKQADDFGGRFKLESLSKNVGQNFIVVDNKHSYICEPHNPIPRPSGTCTLAENSPLIATHYYEKLIRLKDNFGLASSVEFREYQNNTERN